VERIRVGHDSHGKGKGIFLDEIEVIPDDEEPMFFPCSCWLAEDFGDGKIEREIYPSAGSPHTSGTYFSILVSAILLNGKDINDQTSQRGLPSKLVPNILVRPNRNGPFYLM